MLREIVEQFEKLPQKVMTNSLEIDTKKPLIGVVTAESQMSIAHSRLGEVACRVKNGIVASGGTAKILHVPSIDITASYGMDTNKYDLPLRDATADAVEIIAAGDIYDALVFVASEQNIVAGMFLGAIRLNIPCLFVFGGVMSPIIYENTPHGYVGIYSQIAKIKTGLTAYENLKQIEQNMPLAFGTDCERYGQNSFNCVLEALGLAVRGNSTVTAQSVKCLNIAYEAGKYSVYLASEKLTPRRLLTQNSFTNAVVFDLACGGSSTTVLNLIAIAKEMSIKNFNLKTVNDIGKSTPVLLGGQICLPVMQQFDNAGGVYAMVKQLISSHLMNADYTIYNGQTMTAALGDVVVNNSEVIRSHKNCVSPSARLRVLYGNLAEEGCLCHYSGSNSFTGVAKVYNSEELAVAALLCREIHPNDVVVIRNEGPKSGPGMREIFVPLALLEGFGLSEKVAVITDGRIADFYKGIAVGHITPETQAQELFSVLQDGDEIEISVSKGKIQCDVKAKELSLRLKNSDQGTTNFSNNYLKNWSRAAGTATEGCVLKSKK